MLPASSCEHVVNNAFVVVKLAFHDADTDTDSPNTARILRPTYAISSIARILARK